MNPAYRHTIFQVLPEDLPDPFCIITAWNPDGQPDLAGRNRLRDQELANRLDTLALPRVRITGLSPDESHAEPGWAVDCPLEQGLELGRAFQQEGIYRVTEGTLFLVDCASGESTPLGDFAPRIRDPRNRRSFTIHLGSPSPRGLFSPTEALEIRLRTARRFPSFTITRAEGCFRNETEETLLISIATEHPDEVLGLATDLRQHLRQDGVGVSCNGIYQRVTDWSDPEFLKRAWGCPQPRPSR